MARTIVGEIFLNTRAIDGGVGPDVQSIINKASNTAAKVPVDADTRQAEQNVARLAGQIENGIGGAWASAAAQAALFTATVFGIQRAIEGAVNQLAGLFDQLAQARAGFTAILGSESAGGKLLDDIREFARVSPFVTQELVNYSQQLLGVGQSAESIIPLLRSTGDLIASVGGDTQNISRVLFTLTQIRSIGRLVGQDAIQLQSALVPITKLLADFLGKTTAEVKKLQEQGAISADTVFAAITNAGSKVEGAMNNATRNIAGARSVLGDTVKIMAQDTKVLNTVFEDIVAGILGFSNALGSNEALKQDLASIDEALVRVYEDLKPLFEAFSGTGASIALNSLDILASALAVLASVLDSIPQGALEAIGKALAVLFALKAPFALFRYVDSLQRMAIGLKADLAANLTNTAAAIDATGRSSDRAAVSMGKYALSMKQAINAASAAAFALGLFADKLVENDAAAKTLGDTLTTGALGAQIGLAFGPGGALIGAAAGAGIGLITSLVGNARDEAERQAAEWDKMGKEAADQFLAGFKLTTPEIKTGADFNKFFSDTKGLKDTVAAYDELIAKRKALADVIAPRNQDPTLVSETEFATTQLMVTALQNLQKEIDGTADAAEAARSELESLFSEGQGAEAVSALATKLSQLKKESEDYVTLVHNFVNEKLPVQGIFGQIDPRNITLMYQRVRAEAILTGDAMVKNADDIALINEIARTAGLSIDTLLLLPLEELAAIMSGKVPEGITKVRIEILALNTAFEEAKKASSEFFTPFKAQINAAQAAATGVATLNKAVETFTSQQNTANALALGDSLLTVAQNVSTANEALGATNEAFKGSGNEAGVSVIIAQLDDLKERLDLTNPEFQALLEQMGLLNLYNSGVKPGFIGSVEELGTQVGISVDRLKQLIPSLNALKAGQEFTIPINILEALNRLSMLSDGLRSIPVVGAEMAADLEAAIQQIDWTGGIITPVEAVESALGALRLTSVSVFTQMSDLVAELARQSLTADAALRSVNDTFLDIEARRNLDPGPVLQAQNQRNTEALRQDREAKRLAAIAAEAAKEAERQRKEAERLAEEARREAERLAREAAQAAEEALREQARIQKALADSNDALKNAVSSAADQIAQAANAWVTGIRTRAQDEDASSIGRLLRNAGDQSRNLDEINRGLVTLQNRGLSSAAQEAIGIDSVTDIRQVRKLLQASPAQLAQLSSLVATRDSNAEAIARRERQQETQATIVAAILQAASILGVPITPERAEALALNIQVTGDGGQIPPNLIDQLLNGQLIVRA